MEDKKGAVETSENGTAEANKSAESDASQKIHNLDTKDPSFEVVREHFAVISVAKKDYTYKFHMPFGAPLSECYRAAVEVLKEIKFTYDKALEKMKDDALKAKAEKAAAETPVSETPSVEKPDTDTSAAEAPVG